MRGSPHLHALIWTSDCPKLTQETKQDYIEYVDQHVQAYLPDKDKDPDLHESVKKYQTHSHSKSCRKYCMQIQFWPVFYRVYSGS